MLDKLSYTQLQSATLTQLHSATISSCWGMKHIWAKFQQQTWVKMLPLISTRDEVSTNQWLESAQVLYSTP